MKKMEEPKTVDTVHTHTHTHTHGFLTEERRVKTEKNESISTSTKVQNSANIKNRIVYFDILNILACISVILLHCNGIVHTYTDSMAWKTSLIAEVVFFFAVPIFIMLTGANLMGYREKYDTKEFFKKRITKVAIPFVFWALAMIAWKVHIKEIAIEGLNFKGIINMFFLNGEETIYYFMFIILGIYLTLPILSVLAQEKYRKTLWYAVIAIFITKSVLPVMLSIFDITYNGYLSVLLDGYIIFVILGYLMSTAKFEKKQRYIIYLLGIASCIFRYGVTYVLSTRDGMTNRLLFDYIQFHSVFLAVAVFEFIKNVKWDKFIKKEKMKNVISKIAGCSFGIYLIHKIVMYYEFVIFDISEYSVWWRTVRSNCNIRHNISDSLCNEEDPFVKEISSINNDG